MKDKRLEQQLQDSLNRTLSGLRTTSFQREQFFENATGGRKVKRKLTYSFSLALVIALLLATTGVAFALTNGFGILDFARNPREDVEIPNDAEQYIDHDLAVSETEHFTVRFRETSYDGKTCHLVYDVIPKSKDILLISCPTDESWYGLTHLNPDREAMAADKRTILDRWDEGGYASAWEVDIDVYDPNDTEFIPEYCSSGVLDAETKVFTGYIDVPLATLKSERELTFSVRMLPITDIHDENSYDYDRAEEAFLTRVFQAAVSGEEKVLVNTEPIEIPSIGVCINQVRLLVLPQEIQYQIDYSLTDDTLFHSLFDDHPEVGVTVTRHPAFRFITQDADTKEMKLLARGITSNYTQYTVDEEKGIFAQTGSLGRSSVREEYTLGIFRNLYAHPLTPLETVTFQVQGQNPDTFTPEERVWQQQSDRSKPHNEADDTFVNATNVDLSEAEAVAIAKSAILRAHELPESALDHCRVVTNLYVTNQRPDYRRWFIQFQVLKEGSDTYVERFYTCVVDKEGQVIGDPDIDEPTLEEKAAAAMALRQKELERPAYFKRYLEYCEQNGNRHFRQWPYDQKAAYSADMLELTKEYESIEQDIALTLEYTYGIPEDQELSYDAAIALAEQAVEIKYGASSSMAVLCESFDISRRVYPGSVWKFVFSNPDDLYGRTYYRVVLDGTDGHIVEEEELLWQEGLKDREYDLMFF